MTSDYNENKLIVKSTEEKEIKWLELLLNGNSRTEFDIIKSNSRSLLFALCKYKKILRQRGRGYISFIELQRHYDTDITSLHNSINELFLEYYTDNEMNSFLKLMKETNTSILDVYNRHKENPEDTLFSTLTL